MENNKERIHNIDFLRIMAMLSILYFHFHNTITHQFPYPEKILEHFAYQSNFIYLWIDTFFIISGFVLFYTANFKIDFIDFLKKRLIRLYPIMLFTLALYYILYKFNIVNWNSEYNIFSFFLLQNIGLPINNSGALNYTWFVSVLFWVSLFYFYIVKIIPKNCSNLLIALIITFSYIFLENTTPLASSACYYSILNTGVLRGLGGMGIGYFIHEIYLLNKQNSDNVQKTNLFKKIIYTLAEVYLLVQFTYYTNVNINESENTFLFLILFFSVLMGLFVLRKGYLSEFLNKQIFTILNKYTYSIYMVHVLVYLTIYNKFWKIHPNFVIQHTVFSFIFTVSMCIIAGIIIYHFIENPAAVYLKKSWLNQDNKRNIN